MGGIHGKVGVVCAAPTHGALSRKLTLRLRCSSLGLGDDQHPRGYEGSLGPWLDGLWAALAHVQTPVALPAGGLDPPRYRVEVVGTDPTPRVGGACVTAILI